MKISFFLGSLLILAVVCSRAAAAGVPTAWIGLIGLAVMAAGVAVMSLFSPADKARPPHRNGHLR